MNGLAVQPSWVLVLRGIAALAFGVIAFLWPGITLYVLVILFAAYALIAGAAAVFGAVASAKQKSEWGLLLLLGAVSIGAGAVAFLHPGLTALILVLLIAAHALVTGALDIISAVRSRGAAGGRWLLALSGVVAIIFGVLVFLFPGPGAVAMIWLISLYALFSGILLIGAAVGLRGRNRSAKRGSSSSSSSSYTGPERRGPERRVNPDRRRDYSHA